MIIERLNLAKLILIKPSESSWIEFEDGCDIIWILNGNQVIDECWENGRFGGGGRGCGFFGIHFGAQVMSRGQMFESKERIPVTGSTTTRIV